ncbi:hypothetical protein [Paenibacillus glycanilyticus]|uniref:hypothetical protein n=1 Tax=Paenibacillus glycanilyticus TaxID=126569 RepID=UPI000FDC306E|nr:hypothetical protein [Paenibacillus glycanilyticus]
MMKLRHLSVESKYSVLSMVSVSGVLILHLVHWLTMPLIMGTVSEMHHHHQETGNNSSFLMSTVMMVLFLINLASMYFAVRQLIAAVMKKDSHTGHSIVCTTISLAVLCVGMYTLLSF